MKSPEWGILVDIYFFIGGLAGGAYFTAAIADFFGEEKDREIAKIGYYLAFPLVLICPVLLTLDLGVPGRTFNVFQVFKFNSPMSVGSWVLLGFGAFSAFSAISMALEGKERRAGIASFRRLVSLLGVFFGFFIASYTGVLLGATNRPLWAYSRFLGLLFLAIGVTTGMAAIALILSIRGQEFSRSLAKLRRAYTIALFLQAIALVLFLSIVSGGPTEAVKAMAFFTSGPMSLPFWVGAILLGLMAPLILEFRDGFLKGYPERALGLVTLAAILILLGGFLIKYVILAAGQV